MNGQRARPGGILAARRNSKCEFRFVFMLRLKCSRRAVSGMLLFFCAIVADGQPQKLRAPVTVTVVDENGVVLSAHR